MLYDVTEGNQDCEGSAAKREPEDNGCVKILAVLIAFGGLLSSVCQILECLIHFLKSCKIN